MEEIESAHNQGRAVLIVTSLAREVDYVVAAIDSSEIPNMTVTGRTPLDQRLAASEKLRAGSALVVTAAFFAAMQNHCLTERAASGSRHREASTSSAIDWVLASQVTISLPKKALTNIEASVWSTS